MANFTFTSKNFFEALVNGNTTGRFIYTSKDGEVEISAEDITAYATAQIAAIDKRHEAEKARRAAKAAEDPILAAVKDALPEDFTRASDIALVVAETVPDASVSKVIYRLNALVNEGLAEKTDLKIEGQRGTVKGFKRA